MRILLDTNILLSGMMSPAGPPGWLVTSKFQITELRRALDYPKVAQRIRPSSARRLWDNLEARALLAGPPPRLELSPDADDNRILADAVAADADRIVSGDRRGLLALGQVMGIPIQTAREAMEELLRGRPEN